MPEDFALFVDAMSYRIDSVILKNKTGLNLLKARKVAVAGLRKFKKRSNGRFRLSGNLEPIEQQVLECYVSSIVPVIAFTDEELF